jgi:hypothetical protein
MATAKKKVTKAVKKPRAKKPVITDADFNKWFYNLDIEHFVTLTKEWNEENLKIKIPKHTNYDDWFNFFKDLSPTAIRQLVSTGKDFLPIEGYAALSRWADIVSNPSRIDKIHQAGLARPNAMTPEQNILALARKGDRLGVLYAIRDGIAEKLVKGAGARDTASLAKEMTSILEQIADVEKRQAPKKTTKLGKLMNDFDVSKTTKRKPNGKGARHVSYKAKVTIDDMEAA